MSQRKILLLENVASQAAGVRDHLSRAGFQVAISRYEADGLRRLAEWRPDLVLVSTAHPAGDFVDYCRRARALAPAARFVVTSPLGRERLLQDLPGLQAVVSGFLTRPYSPEDVAALVAADPVAPPAPVAVPAAPPDSAELRAEFQRLLEAKFLEVEELKRRLEVATRRAASTPGLEWLQSENDHLRQATQEATKKAALALATEQLKRSELEVKLDNLLRMKEDFEFRTQNEIVQRAQEVETLRAQLQELREGTDRVRAEHDAVRAEMERVLIEKELLAGRLHAVESDRQQEAPPAAAPEATAPAEDPARMAALEAALSLSRAQAAESQAALADAVAQAAVLEETLSREQQARAVEVRREQEHRSEADAKLQQALERVADAERRCARLGSLCEEHEQRARASEAARSSTAAEAADAVAQVTDRLSALQGELAGQGAAAGRREADLASRIEQLERAAGAAASLTRDLEAERDLLRVRLEERQQAGEAEVTLWRGKAEGAARDLELFGSQRAQGDRAQQEELRRRAERLEQASRDLEKSEQRATDLGVRIGELERGAAAALAAAQQNGQAREREARLQLEAQQALCRELEEKLAARALQDEGTKPVQEELHRIQEMLEGVISRARTEAVDHARRDAELSVRLQAALDERRLLQERFDRSSAEATERERRSASLLQSAIDRGPGRAAECANLPAIVPPEPAPEPPEPPEPALPRAPRRTALLAGLAVLALAVPLALFGLRAIQAPVPREPQPPVSRPRLEPAPAPGAGAGATPGEVWDRRTRSDSSGGVLVQATLLGERELRAEVEAERRSRGWSAEQAREELARRLGTFRFDAAYHVTVYLKNLSPGYPAYLDDLAGRFVLRDDAGHETAAFVPAGHEHERRVFTFGAGAPSGLIYEATVPLAFSRAGLSASPGYLQLVVSDVGTASRRVLTWELE